MDRASKRMLPSFKERVNGLCDERLEWRYREGSGV
jgi:hypothetical protein